MPTNPKKVRQHGIKGAYVGGDCKYAEKPHWISLSMRLKPNNSQNAFVLVDGATAIFIREENNARA